nr:undecaprenyl-diphosphatase UppP [Desulfobulbaceae bacterium]
MGYFSSVLLGFLQGATEFLPISSSGHLVLAEAFFKIEEAGLTFDVSLHLGTLLAVLFYFRSDLLAIGSSLFRPAETKEVKQERKSAYLIVVATIPAVVAGLFLEDYAATVFRSPALVACTLVIGGILLLWAEKYGQHTKNYEGLGFKDALIIGLAQALAIVPGVSRSGITMTAGLFRSFDRPSVARFSFLLSVPIIAGAGFLNCLKIIGQGGLEPGQLTFFLIGFSSAAVSGYFFIAFLMRYIQTKSFAVFAYYRFALAGLVLWSIM